MKRILSEHMLKTGETARIVEIIAPDEDGLRGLYEVSPEWKHYYKRAMITGHQDFIEDHLLLAEIDGAPVARLWYAWSKRTMHGNYGNIFTNYAHRQKGLLNLLLDAFKTSFDASPARMLCCHASEWVMTLYGRYGFVALHGDNQDDAMGVVKPELGSCKDYLESLYTDCTVTLVRDGTPGDQFDCDKCLAYTDAMWTSPHRFVFAGDEYKDYQTMLNRALDGRGLLAVAENARGAIVGYASAIKNLSGTAVFLNWRCHPKVSFLDKLNLLKNVTGKYHDSLPLYACIPSCNEDELNLLLKAGFTTQHHLSNFNILEL